MSAPPDTLGSQSAQKAAPATDSRFAEYWRANIRLMLVLLAIWFIVSFGAGILFVDLLDQIRIGGFKLGFFFAQQGAIYVFVVLIFYYAWKMNRLERQYDVDEE
jgi:putative solute:sodium symporter small subunit